jgi:acyl carrier protein
MVPTIWVQLEQMPLTPNGKIDRKALPLPDLEAGFASQYMAPRNELEIAMAEIWQELLGIEKVGINDNFFELGGHSILALKLVSMVSRKMDKDLELMTLISHPTIAQLCESMQ